MKKNTFVKTFILIIVILGGLAVYGYYERPRVLWSIPVFRPEPLGDEEYLRLQSECLTRINEAKSLTAEYSNAGHRVTEPRLFFSSSERNCLATYLVLDQSKPEAGTYNQFFIYNLDRKRELFWKVNGKTGNYEKYLGYLSELESR